ncbi:MAG: hypothetical protein AAFY65_08055 [Pseudomonadota bacterium]
MTPSDIPVYRVPPGGSLPDIGAGGGYGVLVTLSLDPTPLSEMSRIANWIVAQEFGATIHCAPDGTIWDDVVDETGLYPPGWDGTDLPDDLALTSWVSADQEGLEDAVSMLPTLVAEYGPVMILDIGSAPHPKVIADLVALLQRPG